MSLPGAHAQLSVSTEADLTLLVQYRDSVAEYNDIYTGEGLKDPTNQGARRLAARLDSLLASLDDYLSAHGTRKESGALVLSAQRETRRYSSPTARALNNFVSKLAHLLPNLPERLTPAEAKRLKDISPKPAVPLPHREPAQQPMPTVGDTLTQKSEAILQNPADTVPATQPITQLETKPEEKPTAQFGLSTLWNPLVWMTALNVALLVATLFWVNGRVNHMRQQLATDQKNFQNRLRTLATVSEERTEALRADFAKRWDALESNLAMFLQQVEEQRAEPKADRKPQKPSPPPEAPDIAQAEENISLTEEVTGVAPEPEIEQVAAPPVTPPDVIPPVLPPIGQQSQLALALEQNLPPAKSEPSALAQLLTSLAAVTQLPELATACRELVPKLMQPLTPEANPELAVELAQLAQLSYISSINEDLTGPYDEICLQLLDYNIDVLDGQAGKPVAADRAASTYPFTKYFQGQVSNQSGPLPEPGIVRQQLEESGLLKTASRQTVLFVLLPTVVLDIVGQAPQVLLPGAHLIKA